MNAAHYRTSVVLSPDLRTRLVESARAADRTLSAEIRVALRRHLATKALEQPARAKAAA